MKGIITTIFFIQQDTISKTLCENRNKPKLHCNGKCYLAKQLKKEEKKDKGIQKVSKEIVEFPMIAQEFYFFEINQFNSNKEFGSIFLNKNYDSVLKSLFRPPIV
jgi:hypothetical protein